MPVADDDNGLDSMQCHDHPFQNTSPAGGICAFCLQDKLGKLLSSSSSFFIASSSSPSFRSDLDPNTNTHTHISSSATTTTAATASLRPTSSINNHTLNNNSYCSTRKNGKSSSSPVSASLPFLLTQKKKKKSSDNSHQQHPSFLKRSKSTATPRSGRYFGAYAEDYSPRRRGFWSFLHLSSKKSDKTTPLPKPTLLGPAVGTSTSSSSVSHAVDEVAVTVTETAKKVESVVVVEDSDSSPSPNSNNSSNMAVCNSGTTSFGRKVSRSRSVGCGSRSFSGDFFERISTGFGDCTLRRVESQREGGGTSKHRHSTSRVSTGDVIKERVRCGGLFGGFMMITSSSSSSASSSSYWVSSNDEQHQAGPGARAGPLIHGRSRSWGWALASPMRAFNNKPTSGKRYLGGVAAGGGAQNGKSNGATAEEVAAKTANLDAIPSLLSVRG